MGEKIHSPLVQQAELFPSEFKEGRIKKAVKQFFYSG
jgi:hypothetical protein